MITVFFYVALTWFIDVDFTNGLCIPEGNGETPLAEGVKTRQEFGLPVVKAQLADRTRIHQLQGTLLLCPLILCWQTFCLVFHNNNNIVVGNSICIHFMVWYFQFFPINKYDGTARREWAPQILYASWFTRNINAYNIYTTDRCSKTISYGVWLFLTRRRT